MFPAIGPVERDICGFNRQPAAVGHGVAGIHDQIDEGLVNLCRVKIDPPQVFFRIETQVDVLANEL